MAGRAFEFFAAPLLNLASGRHPAPGEKQKAPGSTLPGAFCFSPLYQPRQNDALLAKGSGGQCHQRLSRHFGPADSYQRQQDVGAGQAAVGRVGIEHALGLVVAALPVGF